MPKVNDIDPSIKLIVSGNKSIKFQNKNLINAGFVNKNEFYSFLKGASLFVNPMQTAFGSQVKMISALVFGKTIISSKKAALGLDIHKKKNKLFITDNDKKFADLILKNIDAEKFDNKLSKFYQNIYSLKKITMNFLKEI